VYFWLWDRLPGGTAAKILISSGVILAVIAMLWFWVFPLAEPLLPFDDAQVGQ
jgi:hypothetical protein